MQSLATTFKRVLGYTTRKYQYLKVVELVGSVGSAAVEFITFVLENVASLEKLIVNPCIAWNARIPLECELQNIPEEELAREHAMKLAAELPLGVEFVIL